jgi:hypothetical protein
MPSMNSIKEFTICLQRCCSRSRLQGVGERLRARPVLDTHKSVIEQREFDALGGRLFRQPRMPVAIDLQLERAAGGHTQTRQAELRVHPIKVIVQALAGVRTQECLAGVLVMPGLVACVAEMICAGPSSWPRCLSTLATTSSFFMFGLLMC